MGGGYHRWRLHEILRANVWITLIPQRDRVYVDESQRGCFPNSERPLLLFPDRLAYLLTHIPAGTIQFRLLGRFQEIFIFTFHYLELESSKFPFISIPSLNGTGDFKTERW